VQIDKVAAVIRPRTPWEAVDLGFAMLARWRREVYTAWAFTVLPVCLVVLLTLREHIMWALLVIWWLKPLFDRVPLFVVSRALFGAPPDLRTVIRELPRLWRRNLFGALLLYRLSPRRCLTMPVTELEGLRGARASKRAAVLANPDTNRTASGLTLLCINFELILQGGALLVAWVLLPAGVGPDLQVLVDDLSIARFSAAMQFAFGVAYVVAMSCIEPAYVAGGFALYINRRTFLEGWDVELAFRRLARRVSPPSAGAGAALVLLAVGIALGGAQPAAAQDGAKPDPEVVVQEVLADEEFGSTTTITTWVSDSDGAGVSSLNLFGLLAAVLEAVVWIAVVLLVAWLIYRIVVGASGLASSRHERAPPPTTAFGLDIRPESLPDDVAGQAWALWRAGQPVGALSLLYRGSIARLVERDGLVIEESDTEHDCLRRVQGMPDRAKLGYFRSLTDTWQLTAYGRRQPPESSVRELCDAWPLHFGGAA
jgi:hypothetical protein